MGLLPKICGHQMNVEEFMNFEVSYVIYDIISISIIN